MSEKHLEDLIQQDTVNGPDPRVRNRLSYAFMLKSIRSKARQNSFGGFIGWIFSVKGLGIKTVVATMFLAFVMLKPELNTSTSSNTAIDSTGVHQNLVVDSTLFQINSKSSNDSRF